MRIRQRGRGRLTGYERGSAVAGQMRAQRAIHDTGSHRVLGQMRRMGAGLIGEAAATTRGVRRELDQLGDADVDQLVGGLGSRQALQVGRGSWMGRGANVGRLPVASRIALVGGSKLLVGGARLVWRYRPQKTTTASNGRDLLDKRKSRDQVRAERAAARKPPHRGSALVGAAWNSSARVRSELASGGHLDVDRAAMLAARSMNRRVASAGARVAGRAGWWATKKTGQLAGRAGRLAWRGARAGGAGLGRAGSVAIAAARAVVVKLVAVLGGSVLPVVMAVVAVVLLLMTILPGFVTGAGAQASRREALASVCVRSPYELGPVKPHVEQAAVFLGTKFGVETIGGYRPGNTYDYSGHPAGLALDFMFPMTAEGKSRGQSAAEFMQANAAALGVKYIIWYQKIWSVARAAEGWRSMEDRGSISANHFDHIHLSFNEEPGTGDLTQMLREACGEEMSEGSGAGAGSWVRPASGRVTSPYGMRRHPVTGVLKLHTGVDYGAPCGAPIRAASAGQVTAITPNRAYGTLITVDHGGGLVTRYAHAYRGDVVARVGDRVLAGQQIAKVGSAGYSTGCHLHFEVKIRGDFVDPVTHLRSKGVK